MQQNNQDIMQKLRNISETKLLAIIIGAMIIFLYVRPIGLPIPISDTTQSFYDAIENLPEGSVVAVQCILTPTGYAEQKGGLIAILTHLFSKELKLVFFSVYQASSPPLVEEVISLVPEDLINAREYGKDYVIYGFVAGEEQSLTAIGNNFWDVYPVDSRGTPTDQLSMMENIQDATDFDIILSLSAWFPAAESSVRQWGQTFSKSVIMAVDAAQYMALMPYYPDQIEGVIFGVRGGAEYETLIGKPGVSISFTDAISGMAILLTLALIVGNVVTLNKNKGGQ